MSNENKNYTFSERELETFATKIKNIVLEHLVLNGFIDHDAVKEFMMNYGIVVRKPSWFSEGWNDTSVEDTLQYVLIEQKSILPEPLKEDEKGASVLHLVDFKNNQEDNNEE